MRFPSFIKVPRNKRFQLEPRYYDPVKEEIEERTKRIREEMEGAKMDYKPGQIRFERKTKPAPSAGFLQLLIAAILGSLVIGWLYYGNQVFYALWIVVPVYLYFRLKKNKNTSRRKQQ